MKKHNFFAGPAILPQPVLQQASEAASSFGDMGLSILEISHRSPQFTAVMDEATQLVKDVLELGDDYEVMFLTGGASSQFYMTALNLLEEDDTACFVDTGTWSSKAIKEAKHFGKVEVLATSKDENYSYIPKNYKVPAYAKYLHLTSNNTICGTQYHQWPDTDIPFVCDMSSDIFSKPLETNRFGIIYAGAQKNLGSAGVTLVIIRKDLVGATKRSKPTMLDYTTHIKKGSMFNTPPAFPIYVSMLTMRWIVANGGVEGMAAKNTDKANLLYDEIDNNPLFVGTAIKGDRSLMNVTFVMKDTTLENDFFDACTAAGCLGVKGHRSVGGFRASIYNAMEKDSVQVLVDVMRDFAERKA